MQLPPEYQPPAATMYAHRTLSERLRTEGWAFNLNAMNLPIQARWFAADCALWGFCEEQGARPPSLFFDWQFTAARDAIVALYNFRDAIAGCQGNLRKIKEWKALTDTVALERASEEFKCEFPGIRQLRTTVVHAVELFDNEEQMTKNSAKPGKHWGAEVSANQKNVVISGNFTGPTYSAMHGGVTYEVDLTTDKIHALNKITADILGAFSRLPNYAQPGWPRR